MIRKYKTGTPFETEAVVQEIPALDILPELPNGGMAERKDNKLTLKYTLDDDDIVWGLGESMRGMNKRGWEYISWALDDPDQYEDRRNLYAAHNFILIDPKDKNKKPFGLFIDDPGKVRFDIGYTRSDMLEIDASENVYVYVIEGDTPEEIVHEFRKSIGQSYIPPEFAFGYAQSRWGYRTKEDFRNVIKNLKDNNIPVDMVNMDIDYMQDFKDFTLNEENFAGDFPEFVQEMKDQNIHLVPIIDAAVKQEDGYSIHDEGVKNNYFVKLEDGKTDFVGAVWPGYSLFPDFLNKDAARWFGDNYKFLTDAGIDAFWNDMNEPALFYSKYGLEELAEWMKQFVNDPESVHVFDVEGHVGAIKNSMDDYKRMYHNVDGKLVRHDKVHNMYGYSMTRSAGEAFERLRPNQRTLMYSRSSYIGMHRYGGIWSGDNKSWWSHIKLILSQLPGLNMSGFLYTGCDLGGFGADTTRDLVLRYTQLGVFTPLMRNHACAGTRDQEPYRFEHPEDFAHVIGVRYQLIPYLYSEFMKAALNDKMMFRPLSFVYPEDDFARRVEDQLMLGDEIMIAPVYEQNAKGRYVYLPEEMMFVVFKPDGTIKQEILEKGHHYINYALNEVAFFIRKDKAIPVIDKAMNTAEMDMNTMRMLGYDNAGYDLYEDDGISKTCSTELRHLIKEAA